MTEPTPPLPNLPEYTTTPGARPAWHEVASQFNSTPHKMAGSLVKAMESVKSLKGMKPLKMRVHAKTAPKVKRKKA